MIRRLLKWILRIAAVLVLLVVLLLVFKNAILCKLAEARIQEATGMKAKIGKFTVGFRTPLVRIKDFKLYNTTNFGGTLFLNIPELYVELDPVALAKKELHVKLLRFNLGELDIVKNEKGQTNVVSLMAKTQGQGQESATEMLKRAGLKFTGIDELSLTLGKARFVDLKDKNQDREFKLGLKNVVLKNVKTEQDLYLKLFVAILTNGVNGGLTPQNLLESYLHGKTFSPQGIMQDILTAPAKH